MTVELCNAERKVIACDHAISVHVTVTTNMRARPRTNGFLAARASSCISLICVARQCPAAKVKRAKGFETS